MFLDNLIEVYSNRALCGGLLILFCGIHIWLFDTDFLSILLLTIGIVLGSILVIGNVRD
jgi:hypothetical protein